MRCSGAGTPASAAAVAGKIALVDRGLCGFIVKLKNAQDAGAAAVLVADNVPDNPPPGLGGSDPTITIPSARVLQATGNTLKAAISPVTVTLVLNQARRARTDLSDRPQLYASTQARVWFTPCEATTRGARAFEDWVDRIAKQAHKDDILTGKQSSHLCQCAQTRGKKGTN